MDKQTRTRNPEKWFMCLKPLVISKTLSEVFKHGSDYMGPYSTFTEAYQAGVKYHRERIVEIQGYRKPQE